MTKDEFVWRIWDPKKEEFLASGRGGRTNSY